MEVKCKECDTDMQEVDRSENESILFMCPECDQDLCLIYSWGE